VPGLTPVDLSAERIQLAGLRTAPVVRAPLAAGVRAVGTVSAAEGGLAVIHTRVAGWIEELRVDETGVEVRKGEILARLYSPEVLAAEQELLTALRWASAPRDPAVEAAAPGRDLVADARHRLELLGIATSEIDEITRTQAPVRAVPIRSPVRGHVTRKSVVRGQYVQPGSQLFEIADLSKVWVIAELAENEIARVRDGAAAQVELAAFPERVFEGKVALVYPTVAPDTRTVPVRIELANPDRSLRPGMHGDVQIAADPAAALVVPAEALVDTGVVQYVFVAQAGGRFEPRKVKAGRTTGESVQILEGLREGEIVVTTANFLVDSESRLAAAIAGLGAEGPTPGTETVTESESATESDSATASESATESGTAAGAEARPRSPTRKRTPPSACDRDFDRAKYPDKHARCLACEVQHRGMGSMVDDCKRAIAKPWR
jgi:Cu(I)/Ag(I) efflux system membrane fusion protein